MPVVLYGKCSKPQKIAAIVQQIINQLLNFDDW